MSESVVGKSHFSQAKKYNLLLQRAKKAKHMKPSSPSPTGRPPKPSHALRSKKVTAAFTESEYNRLLLQSEQSRIRLSKLVSQLAADGQVVSKFSDQERAIITELRKFYNSVNQLNKSLNYFRNNLSDFSSKKQEQKLKDVLDLVDHLLE